MSQAPLFLAVDQTELIAGAIGLVILFLSWLWKLLKGELVDRQTESDEPSEASLEQKAAQRQEQLRRAAQQQASHAVRQEAANLTLAQRIERARIAARQRQKPRSLGEAKRPSAERPSVPSVPAASSESRPPAAPPPKPPPVRARSTLAPAPMVGTGPLIRRPRRRVRTGEAARGKRLSPPAAAQPAPLNREARGVASAQEPAKPVSSGVRLRGRSLRDAIVLKEILDRPVGLRPPGEGVI